MHLKDKGTWYEHVVNFIDVFEKRVIDDFVCQYKKCRTPNPCIECNKKLSYSQNEGQNGSNTKNAFKT